MAVVSSAVAAPGFKIVKSAVVSLETSPLLLTGLSVSSAPHKRSWPERVLKQKFTLLKVLDAVLKQKLTPN